MGGGFKLRLSRMFRSSFGLCRSRSAAVLIEKQVFISKTRNDFHPIEPLSPKDQSLSSISTPRMESSSADGFATMEMLQSSEVMERSECVGFDDSKGRTCPPASPASPLNSYYKLEEFEPKGGKIRSKETKSKKTQRSSIRKKGRFHFDSSSGESDSGWFSTEESGDEAETFFSSKSFSSDSSEIYRRNENFHQQIAEVRRRRDSRRNSEMGHDPFDSGGIVKESIAVVKRSSNPYKDFKTSMVEMILEKQLFAAEDLEKLLECFLSLNSSHYHRVIMEVFNEIWDTLFSNRS
ncbi:transcription repressor OFP8-like [Macadamia integrifolia]|uniref:transcription repressor OFP8-like n=1 Tax=Macadamia integrifolia TaxID=60698 RepID=UPI001C4E36E4|nr:transcription repressor OFP8-like [Macadamia integrifolia]